MKQLSIIQTADIHGNIADYAYVSAYVKSLRARGEPVLVVDSGDIFRGSILSEFSGGTVTAAIMNEIGYDFMVFGNDEHFKDSGEIEAMRARLSFPVLGALTKKADGSRQFDPYGVKAVGGFSIGAIGLEASMAPPGPKGPGGGGPGGPGAPGGPGGSDSKQLLEQTRLAVADLQARGCDLLMVISHVGVDDTYPYPTPQLARDVPELDLIADGHSHHPLPQGIRVGKTLVTQPEDHLGSFVHIRVTEDDRGSRETACKLVLMSWCRENLTPDPVVAELLGREAEKVRAATITYAETPFLLDGGRPQIRQKETNLGDVVCDALLHRTGAEIAICGGGAIRASLRPGPITNFDVSAVFANGGNLGLYQCRGRWLLDQLERSLSAYPTQTTAFLQLGGLWVTFSPEAAPGARILTAKLSEGEALDPEKTYLVAKEMPMFGGPGGHGHQQDGPDSVLRQEMGTLEEAFTGYLQSGTARFFEGPAGRILAV